MPVRVWPRAPLSHVNKQSSLRRALFICNQQLLHKQALYISRTTPQLLQTTKTTLYSICRSNQLSCKQGIGGSNPLIPTKQSASELWPSGRRRYPRKVVGGITVSRVRIPQAPPTSVVNLPKPRIIEAFLRSTHYPPSIYAPMHPKNAKSISFVLNY